MPRRLVAVVSWLCVAVALLPVPAAAQDPCEDAGNLTYNCQFDSFAEVPGGQVAQGWWPFVISGHPAFDQSTESPKAPAQRIWSDGEGFVAGIYQTVSGITPGATYQAYIGWFVFQSTGPEMGRSIGIDPTGGTDPTSAGIVWSPEVWEKKRLAPELVARAVAEADKVTVFLRVNHPKTYGADQAFLDAASLVVDASVPVVSASPAPTETPVPTATEAPTATPLPVTAATDTPVATAASTSTATALSTVALTATATESPTAVATATATATATERPTAVATATSTPTATAEPAATATPTRTAIPAATGWDMRSGTSVAQLAFAPAAAPRALPAASRGADSAGQWLVWTYVLAATILVSIVAYALVRPGTGGRDRG